MNGGGAGGNNNRWLRKKLWKVGDVFPFVLLFSVDRRECESIPCSMRTGQGRCMIWTERDHG